MAESASLGELNVFLGADISAWDRAFADAKELLDAFAGMVEAKAEEVASSLDPIADGFMNVGKVMSVASAAIVAPLTAAAYKFGSMGSQMLGMSKRLNMSVETLSALGFAAQETGVDLQELGQSFRFLNMAIASAQKGGEAERKVLSNLKLPWQVLKSMKPEEQLMAIADGFKNMKDPVKRTQTLIELFGRSGMKMNSMMMKGKEGIKAMMKEAEELGFVISEKDAKAAKEFTIATNKMHHALSIMTFYIGSAVAPKIKETADWVTSWTKTVKKFAQENKDLISTLFTVAKWLGIVGASLYGVGLAIKFVRHILLTVGPILTFLRGLSLAMIGSFLAWSAAIVLVTVAIAALLDMVLQLTGAGNLGILDLIGNFRIFGVTINTIFQSIWLNVLSGFDWVLTKIMNGLDWIKIGFATLGEAITSIIGSMAASIFKSMKDVITSITRTAYALHLIDDEGLAMADRAKTALDKSIGATQTAADELHAYGEKLQNQIDARNKAHEDYAKNADATQTRLMAKDQRELEGKKKLEEEETKRAEAMGMEASDVGKATFKQVGLGQFSTAGPTLSGIDGLKAEAKVQTGYLQQIAGNTAKPSVAVMDF